MNKHTPLVSLGFTEKKVHAGAHICQIYCQEHERNDSLLKFLLSGLQSGERSACFSEKVDEETLREFLASKNISYDDCKKNQSLSLAATRAIYFQNNLFDPDRMLDQLTHYYKESLAMGFTESRVIGEMLPEVQEIHGGNRLLEYESRVSVLLKECPITAVCQYDANAFDGATIMDILKVHPQMIVNGTVINNPFFISPEEFLKNV